MLVQDHGCRSLDNLLLLFFKLRIVFKSESTIDECSSQTAFGAFVGRPIRHNGHLSSFAGNPKRFRACVGGIGAFA